MGWGSLAFEPEDEGKGAKHLLTPEAPGFSRGAAHLYGRIFWWLKEADIFVKICSEDTFIYPANFSSEGDL
jgi:hypothetical protein